VGGVENVGGQTAQGLPRECSCIVTCVRGIANGAAGDFAGRLRRKIGRRRMNWQPERPSTDAASRAILREWRLIRLISLAPDWARGRRTAAATCRARLTARRLTISPAVS